MLQVRDGALNDNPHLENKNKSMFVNASYTTSYSPPQAFALLCLLPLVELAVVPSNPAEHLDVLWLDCDSLCMDGQEVGHLQGLHQVFFGFLLESCQRLCLDPVETHPPASRPGLVSRPLDLDLDQALLYQSATTIINALSYLSRLSRQGYS